MIDGVSRKADFRRGGNKFLLRARAREITVGVLFERTAKKVPDASAHHEEGEGNGVCKFDQVLRERLFQKIASRAGM